MKTSLIIVALVAAILAAVLVPSPVSAGVLVLQPGPEEGKDTYICDCSPNENNPNGPVSLLYQGRYQSCYDRLLIQWDISALPQAVTIDSALMELRFNVLHGSQSGQLVYYPILEDWVETEVTYATQPAYSHDDSVLTGWPSPNQWHAVNVTGFVRQWYDGSLDNYGIYGHCLGATSTSCAEFCSSDHSNTAYWPRLTIAYTGQAGAEPEDLGQSLRLELPRSSPNPFRSSTTVTYWVGTPTRVSLKVLDLLNREVADLVSSAVAAGEHHVTWSPSGVPPGTYLLRLAVGDDQVATRATLLSAE